MRILWMLDNGLRHRGRIYMYDITNHVHIDLSTFTTHTLVLYRPSSPSSYQSAQMPMLL